MNTSTGKQCPKTFLGWSQARHSKTTSAIKNKSLGTNSHLRYLLMRATETFMLGMEATRPLTPHPLTVVSPLPNMLSGLLHCFGRKDGELQFDWKWIAWLLGQINPKPFRLPLYLVTYRPLKCFFVCFPGYEYTVEATFGGYGPVEKTYHLCRRRRWVRNRVLVKDSKGQEEEVRLGTWTST